MNNLFYKLALPVIAKYQSLIAKQAEENDQDHKRYLNLANFLGLSMASKPTTKKALDEDEKAERERAKQEDIKREKSKEKKFKGDSELTRAFSVAFQDLLEPYMPGGHFTWNEWAKEIANDFYKMAYKGLRDAIPRLISKKLKSDKYNVSPSEIKLNPEAINELITDMLLFVHSNPMEFRKLLAKSFKKDAQLAESLFRPKMDDETYAEKKDQAKKEKEPFTLKRDSIDETVVNELKDRDSVKWSWKGIDENKNLTFTMPELYGGREFKIPLPEGIQNIREGDYTFDIKRAGKKGIVVEFVEQKKDLGEDVLENVRKTGLGKDQLKNLINQMIIRYRDGELEKKSTSDFIEDLSGIVSIKGDEIGSAEELNDIVREPDNKQKGTKKDLKVFEKKEQAEGVVEEAKKEMIDRWGPVIGEFILKMDKEEGANLSKAIAAKFPEKPAWKKGGRGEGYAMPGFEQALAISPIIRLVTRIIMSPTTPTSARGVSDAWSQIAAKEIKQKGHTIPSFAEAIKEVIATNKKKDLKKIPIEQRPETVEVSDQEVQQFLTSVPDTKLSKAIFSLRKPIEDKMSELRQQGDSAVKKFFDRRNQFQAYIDRGITEEIEKQIETEHIDPTTDEGRKALDKTIKKFVDDTVKKMTRKYSHTEQIVKAAFERLSSTAI